MATDAEIRTAMDRARRAVELRRSMALGTMSVTVDLEEGLKCVSRCEDWRLEMDEPTSVGGENAAPTPGFYGCSALGGCFAITLKMIAAQAELAIESIAVEVAGDYDDRGAFGIDDVAPGYLRFRLGVAIDSPAPPERLRELVEAAKERSSWFAVFGRPQDTAVSFTVNGEPA